MDIVEIEKLKNNDKQIENFMKKADMVDNLSKKRSNGRPPKKDDEKASEQVFVNLNKQQKQLLEEHAKSLGISVSAAIKMILMEKGIIK
jgi:hypothetical protein